MAHYEFSTKPRDVPVIKTAHRKIQTAIPIPETAAILESLEKVEARSMHGQLPLIWDQAIDYQVLDKAGNTWIDFTSGIFVANVGHANAHVKLALQQIMDKNLLHTYTYATDIRTSYLQKLIEFAGPPFEKAFLLSAGTEATECAVKLMSLHGMLEGKSKGGIICLDGNWHGRTMGAQLMSSAVEQKKWINHEAEYIHHLAFPYPWDLQGKTGAELLEYEIKQLMDQGINPKTDICGVMLETFQGWGAIFYPNDFVIAMRNFCDENNILLAFDEMQAGFGRTGKNFGFQHYDVTPDIICCGKGMSSAVPLSAVISTQKIMDLPEIGSMSSTHSANPLACAAGLATIEEIEQRNLVSETARKGKLLHQELQRLKEKYPQHISHIFGTGLIAAVLFKTPETQEPDGMIASLISERCLEKGLLVVHTGRESIKLGPPLTIPDDALLEGISVLDEAISEMVDAR